MSPNQNQRMVCHGYHEQNGIGLLQDYLKLIYIDDVFHSLNNRISIAEIVSCVDRRSSCEGAPGGGEHVIKSI